MEMDPLLWIPPPDTFWRLGFGGFLWDGCWYGSILCLLGVSLLSQRLLINIVAVVGLTHPGTVTGTVGSHRTEVVKWYRLKLVRQISPLCPPYRVLHLVRSSVRSGATVPWLVKWPLMFSIPMVCSIRQYGGWYGGYSSYWCSLSGFFTFSWLLRICTFLEWP